MKLIVGLGNPGSEYADHRHNAGFWVLDDLASRLSARSFQDKFDGELTQLERAGEKWALLKPQTYMNLSGRSAGAAARFFKIPVESVLVIHDELDLPFGRLQLKSGGGSGGHNGLKSLTDALGDGYARLRFGVGRPEGLTKERVADYVLSDCSKEERKELPFIIQRASEMAIAWAELGMAKAMNQLNRK